MCLSLCNLPWAIALIQCPPLKIDSDIIQIGSKYTKKKTVSVQLNTRSSWSWICRSIRYGKRKIMERKGFQPNDEAVISTNDDASECKRYAAGVGYWKDDYIGFFVKNTDRKAPEINRGYFARVNGIQCCVEKFLKVLLVWKMVVWIAFIFLFYSENRRQVSNHKFGLRFWYVVLATQRCWSYDYEFHRIGLSHSDIEKVLLHQKEQTFVDKNSYWRWCHGHVITIPY